MVACDAAGLYRVPMSSTSAGVARRLADVADRTDFSGVARVSAPGRVIAELARGHADHRHGVENRLDTRFAVASGVKGLTALAVASLAEDGLLRLDDPARGLLGDDLPLVDDDVTIAHLLAHRSGIGDYLDEDDLEVTDYVMPVPVHQLAETEDYLAVLGGFPMVARPDEEFAYCNGGFVVLALLAERAARKPFRDVVHERVCVPAGMADTAFLRSDELPPNTAVGYLTEVGGRTNVLHLPVRGSGDGGVYTTLDDVEALWIALHAGRIVPPARVAQLVEPRSHVARMERRYGLGFWLHETSDVVMLEGYDAGVSFWTAHDPATSTTWTVISNTSDGAWDLVELLVDELPR